MRILIENQYSNLSNSDVKWYLADEKLWIAKHNEYKDIEKSIEISIGSFNWLYEINDTVLFRKYDKTFETAIMDLAGKIHIGVLDSIICTKNEIKGNLVLKENENFNFEFPYPITYIKKEDCFISYLVELKEEIVLLFIADDFAFIIVDDRLEGWIVKNASIYDNSIDLLADYLHTLNLW